MLAAVMIVACLAGCALSLSEEESRAIAEEVGGVGLWRYQLLIFITCSLTHSKAGLAQSDRERAARGLPRTALSPAADVQTRVRD